MLRVIMNKSWRDKITNKELYGDIPRLSDTILIQRLRFAGHCWRSKNELVSDVLLWQPQHGKNARGRPAKTYIDQLRDDTDLQTSREMKTAMEDRDGWKKMLNVMEDRVRSTW